MQNLDIKIIRWLQTLENNFLNKLFEIITFFGEPIFFILVGVLIYWLYNKREAFKLVISFFVSFIFVGMLKVTVKRKRPHELNAEGIKLIGKRTDGHSFPSGHSQSASVMFFGANKVFDKKPLVFYPLLVLVIFIPISRMYLGHHFLTDVVVGLLIGALTVYGVYYFIDKLVGEKEHLYALYVVPFAVIGLIVLMVMQLKTSSANMEGFINSYGDLFKMVGAYIGFAIGYALEKMFVNHNVEATTKVKLLKVLVGAVPLLIIYFALSFLFGLLTPNGIYDAIRYMLVAIWGVLGAPWLFTVVFKNK